MKPLLRILHHLLARTRYHALYPCEVQRQSEDWSTLDLLPDDPSIRGEGLQDVPIWHGLPGFGVKVAQGSRVMLGFRDGDPSRPYASLWEQGQVEHIRFDGGDQPFARVGDAVRFYWPPGSLLIAGAIPAGAITGTVTISSPGFGIIESGQQGFTG